MPDEMNQQPQQVPPVQETPVQPAQEPVQQQVVSPQPVATVGTSGLAIAGLVLGILAFLLSFIPLMNFGSIIMGLLGLILAVVGLISTKNGKHKGKGIAIAGIILSILAIAVVFLMYGTAAAVSENNKSEGASASATQQAPAQASAQQNAASSNAQDAAASAAPEQEEAAASAAEDAKQETSSNAKYAVSIDGARLGQDYDGNEVAIVTYTWTNNSDEATAFAYQMNAKAFQNSVEINDYSYVTDLDNDGYLAEVKPGGSTSFEWAYPIKDHSDLTVEVVPIINLSKEVYAEATFSLE